jgi:hypothetical protein
MLFFPNWCFGLLLGHGLPIFRLQQGEDNFKQRKDERRTNAQACVHHSAVLLHVQNVLQNQQRITLKQ